MKLNHMNLVVPDVVTAAHFFEKHFGFRIDKLMRDLIAVLTGSDGFVLVISHFPNTASFEYPSDFHIGFYQETQEQVMALFESLKADGLALEQAPKNIRDRFGFYFYMPGKILVEVTCAV